MPAIYRCTLELMEITFFSSREVSAVYQTEPLIGNYALAYALGFCRAPYHSGGPPRYAEDLGGLNQAGLYVTPATMQGVPRFSVGEFNAQPETYWYAMGNNKLVTRPDQTWAESSGAGAWYIIEKIGEKGSKLGVENRPQHGRIRYLAIGNRAVFYVVSQAAITIPRYIRLGKFMSKARVEAEPIPERLVSQENVTIDFLLNPADLPPTLTMQFWDTINVPPAPLVRNLRCSGAFYQIGRDGLLPAQMTFGI
jgi:CRISPR-associated protein Csc1